MRRLDAAGAHYVTLAQAQSDPAYAESGGGSLLARAAQEKQINTAGLPALESNADVKDYCR
jgi:hypothetical protein